MATTPGTKPLFWDFKDGALAGRRIRLLTPAQLQAQPQGTVLYTIWGRQIAVGPTPLEAEAQDGYVPIGPLV